MDCNKPLKNLKIKIHFSRYAFLFHRYILFLVNQNHFSNATSCEDTILSFHFFKIIIYLDVFNKRYCQIISLELLLMVKVEKMMQKL